MIKINMKSIITIAAILVIILFIGIIVHVMVNGLPPHLQQFLQ
ncbi:MAG: hypothetical protein O8C63_11940 [Candidatus Methanoperedens sp.]|nr:hypothetical protein [Candidatus Methanoperedens sp.]